MRVVRVKYQEQAYYAAIDGNLRLLLDSSLSVVKELPQQEVPQLSLCKPSKIVCVGLNYMAHAKELDKKVPQEPLLFLKPPSSIIGDGEIIYYPAQSGDVHYEGELAVVIGQKCRRVDPKEVKAYILGYTCANDVTARDLQGKDGLYARAKGFDTFCPLGPWIETEINDPGNLYLRTLVNGIVRQQGHTSDMVVSTFELISFVSQIMTLLPGDVLLTGTPPGVGAMYPGDRVQVEIESIGILENEIKEDKILR